MLFTILRRDLVNKKRILITLFLFITLASFLAITGATMLIKLEDSIDFLFAKSSVPDFVQLQSGGFDTAKLLHWSSAEKQIKNSQITKMLNINAARIYLGNSNFSEGKSVMSMDFVTQNPYFDFLLNLKGDIIYLKPGEIAVPIYFVEKNKIKIGDHVKIVSQDFSKQFTIVAIARDALMSPSIVHSKRFLVNSIDFSEIEKHIHDIGQLQYLIEFQLKSPKDLRTFTEKYQAAGLPSNGPTLNADLFKILNSVSNGIVIGILMLMSVLLILVALLCLRFTILTSLEEDYRQIGIMKAIGIPSRYIRQLYLIKYMMLVALAVIVGYLLTFISNHYFDSSMRLYLGEIAWSLKRQLIIVFINILIFGVIVLFCALILRRFNQVSVLKALNETVIQAGHIGIKHIPLIKKPFLDFNILFGLLDACRRFKLFFILFFISLVCAFIAIVPINFLNTLKSPSFITYMGVGQSQVRIDLENIGQNSKNINHIISTLKEDREVEKYTVLTTSRFWMHNNYAREALNVETGDFTAFPLDYLKGHAPKNSNEIALSYLNSKKLKKHIGDNLELYVDGNWKTLTISGIYQDVTNGGETAISLLKPNKADIVWYIIYVNLKSSVLVKNKVVNYAKQFYPARVTDIHDYLLQTLGDLIKNVQSLAFLSMLISLFLAALIVCLFLKMLLAKDSRSIAIMKAVGFSSTQIKIQYFSRIFLIAGLGIFLGAWLSTTLGELMMGAVWSFMGAPRIHFIVYPAEVFFICPFLILLSVVAASVSSLTSIHRIKITEMVTE